MKKRKQEEHGDVEDEDMMTGSGSELEDMERDSEMGSDNSMIDVNFEFFDPRAGDQPVFRSFLQQHFGPDQDILPLHDVAQAIVDQPLLGSCVKTEGSESDPYAFLTILNLSSALRQGKSWASAITEYFLEKSRHVTAAHNILEYYLKKPNRGDLGWFISERLINMPTQVVPPMYRMLLKEEVMWALEDGEEYQFEWYMIMCKVYVEQESKLDEELEESTIPVNKRKKKKAEPLVFYYQPEEELLEKFAEQRFDFHFTKPDAVADSRRAFQDAGIVPFRRVFLIPRRHVEVMVETLERAVGSESE